MATTPAPQKTDGRLCVVGDGRPGVGLRCVCKACGVNLSTTRPPDRKRTPLSDEEFKAWLARRKAWLKAVGVNGRWKPRGAPGGGRHRALRKIEAATTPSLLQGRSPLGAALRTIVSELEAAAAVRREVETSKDAADRLEASEKEVKRLRGENRKLAAENRRLQAFQRRVLQMARR